MKLHNPAKGARLLNYPEGHIYQGYGENVELYCNAIKVGDTCLKGHNGIDIAMPQGTPILATAGRIVDVKDTPSGYGKHVRIITDPDENGREFLLTYGHLDTILLPLGMRVTDGQQIGTMGNTGFVISGSTQYWGNAPAGVGVHLHFGVTELKPGYWDKYGSFSPINYDNGRFGSIDPMPFFPEEIAMPYLNRIAANLAQQIIDILQSKINSLLKK